MMVLRIAFLILLFAPVCLAAEIFFHDTFEADSCGMFPRGWRLYGWDKKGEARECCRYVTNVESLTGEKSLAYDFSQLPMETKAGRDPHAYTVRKFPVVKDEWAELSFCFKRDMGSLSVEIRGEHKNGNGIKIPWWIKIGDTLTLKSAGSKRREFATAGSVRPKVWYRATFRLPTIDGKQKFAQVRLDRYLGAGKFENGEWKDATIGKMELTAPYTHFDFTGYGQSKYFIDDVIFKRARWSVGRHDPMPPQRMPGGGR